MRASYGGGNLSRLNAKLREAASMVEPNSGHLRQLKGDIRNAVIAGNREDILRGVDRYGQPVAPLAASTLRHRKGNGPPRAPRGAASRFVTNFRAVWVPRPGNTSELDIRWVNMPWVQYHILGTSRMPRRDPSGISPKTWAVIHSLQERFRGKVRDVLRKR